MEIEPLRALKNNLPKLALTVNGFSVMFPAMPDAQVVEWIREKYVAIVADLDERARRTMGCCGSSVAGLGWNRSSGSRHRTVGSNHSNWDKRAR